MALAGNVAAQNSARDAFVADFPAGSVVDYYTGSAPAATAAATGTLLASITLPASPWTTAAGQVTKNGTWSVAAAAVGTPGYFRLRDASSTKIRQGVIGTDGTAATIANAGDTYTITTFTVTFP